MALAGVDTSVDAAAQPACWSSFFTGCRAKRVLRGSGATGVFVYECACIAARSVSRVAAAAAGKKIAPICRAVSYCWY